MICDRKKCPYYNLNRRKIEFSDSYAEVEVKSLYFGVNMLISGASDIISPIGHEDLGLYYFLYESGVMITIAHCVIFAQICFLYNFGRGWFFNQVELLIKQLKVCLFYYFSYFHL